ncbi:MAG: hypothetical protein JRC68_03535 [Deltaproteobacteria bacterium]|nr:hypothetical protein [Deltaproteobacteria bacterium]
MNKNGLFLKSVLCATAFSVLTGLFIADHAISYEFYDWGHGAIGYELAVMDAEEDKKPLILYFYLDSDEWSEKMNNDYLAVYEVEAFLIGIPKVEINPGKGGQEKSIAVKYGVDRCPAFFVSIPSFGSKPQRIHPFSKDHNLTVDEFIKELKGVIVYQYNEKAYQHYEKKEYEEALKYFEMARDFDPGKAYTYYAIGTVYHSIGFEKNDPEYLEKAEENYVEALEIDPDNKETKEELKKLREGMEKLGVK